MVQEPSPEDRERLSEMQSWLEEPLHPDLVPYLRPNPFGGGQLVHHPLVVESIVHIPGHANRMYLGKLESLARTAPPHGIGYYERPYRLATILEWWRNGTVQASELDEELAWAWSDMESDDTLNDPQNLEIIELWREIGFFSDRERIGPPRRNLRVWRGGSDPMGLAWSTSRDMALWFANRGVRMGFDPEEILWMAYAPPEAVLARIFQRNEQEVVVDPRLLTRVRRVPLT